MASVSNISLSLANSSAPDKRNVTVQGTMNFDPGDVGKTYRLEIKVFGEDLDGDKLPSTDNTLDDDLYTYKWGLFSRPYRTITVAAAGAQAFTETRAVSNATLDEDAGNVVTNTSPDINTPPLTFPRRDEVYAKVSLAGAPVSQRSPTVIASFGV